MVLAYQWGLHLWPRLGWLIGFLFVICGAMRLARFNIRQSTSDKRFFVGLPIPAAAGVVAALVYRFPEPLATRADAVLLIALVMALSLLMVSRTARTPRKSRPIIATAHITSNKKGNLNTEKAAIEMSSSTTKKMISCKKLRHSPGKLFIIAPIPLNHLLRLEWPLPCGY